MEFNFSIKGALKESWELFKKHIWFFISLSAVTAVLNLLGGSKKVPGLVVFILMIVTFVWSVLVMKVSLAAADNKEESFSFSKIKSFLPDWKQALGIVGVGIIGGLLVLCGLILLIIPGIWVAFRLSVANLSYLDKNEGVRKALRTSWDMTKGKIFWTAVLVGLVAGFLYIVGLIVFGIGILVTYPLAIILMAKFYRALTVHHGHTSAVVVQPAEILSPEPEMHHESETPTQ
jgi:membrane-anchored glycerophosphoryl diester phosphodiesterase (GDPDase)